MISRLMKACPVGIAMVLSVSILFHPLEKRCVFKPEAFGDPESVSYTHLDVYKRQGISGVRAW